MSRLPLVLVVIALFLAPIIGGQVYVEALPLSPGGSNFLAGMLGGYELPTAAHTVLALLACSSLATSFAIRRINQVVNWRLGLTLAVFAAALGASVAISQFQFVSMQSWIEWLSYLCVLAAVVACAGRRQGILILMGATTAGCTVVAIQGILEFTSKRADDPTWRIFANWNNPNALAAVLIIGLAFSISLAATDSKWTKLLGISATVLQLLAIVLTQSKGVLIFALPAMMLSALVMLSIAGGFKKSAIHLAVIAAIAIALFFGIQASSSTSKTGSLTRITNSSATSTQSVGYRKLLWQSSVELAVQNPAGVGVGTFRYSSAKPGLNPQTHFSHNSFLQIWAEGGWLAISALVTAFVFWLLDFFRGAKSLDPQSLTLRAGVLAAVLGVGAHCMVDSDLHYYGIGFLFFAVLGIGLQLSPDGSAPELMPKSARTMGIVVLSLISMSLCYFAYVEYRKSELRFALITQRDGADALAAELASLAPRDGEAAYMRSFLAKTPQSRLASLEVASRLSPSTKILRSLARTQSEIGNETAAVRSLLQALREDPKNLPTRLMLVESYEKQQLYEAMEKEVEALIAIESSQYFQTRALPESVPTETYLARVLLQDHAAKLGMQPDRQATLLQEAIDGMLQYYHVTYPKVKLFANQPDPMPFAGESLQAANAKLDRSADAAIRLARIYSSLGKESLASAAREAASTFGAR